MMKKHLQYLSYVIRHKWYVMIECFKYGLYWQGIIHDWSKFLPSEWFPYVDYFYGDKTREIRDETGYYKPHDTGHYAFDFAWLLHQKRNKHHWQWWVLPKDDGGIKVLEMSDEHQIEMLADWIGAGKAQGTPDTKKWYKKNQHKMSLHSATRKWVEEQIL